MEIRNQVSGVNADMNRTQQNTPDTKNNKQQSDTSFGEIFRKQHEKLTQSNKEKSTKYHKNNV